MCYDLTSYLIYKNSFIKKFYVRIAVFCVSQHMYQQVYVCVCV